MVSKKLSNKWKRRFPHHQRKLNVSPNIFHKENTKKLDYFLLISNKNRGMIMNPVQLFRENVLL